VVRACVGRNRDGERDWDRDWNARRRHAVSRLYSIDADRLGRLGRGDARSGDAADNCDSDRDGSRNWDGDGSLDWDGDGSLDWDGDGLGNGSRDASDGGCNDDDD
jgi:hypothetical protein